MAQRRHHYERAFEEYLRSRRIPYVSVDEARKALIPARASPATRTAPSSPNSPAENPDPSSGALKSFDFVIYGQDGNLLIDIKGRRVAPRGRMDPSGAGGARLTTASRSRLECWVTHDDINSLTRWESLFGDGFQAAFVFVYWCVEQPPDALFQEVFEYRGRWYALRAVTLAAYRQVMKPRSLRWRTVDIPSATFERVSQPFAPPIKPDVAPTSSYSPATPSPERRAATPASDSPVVTTPASPDEQLCSLDDPDFRSDFGPQLPALHPYTSPIARR